MARISDKEKSKLKSFLWTMKHNPSKKNLESLSLEWYDFLVDLYNDIDYVNKLTEIPFYHWSLYEEYKDIYDRVLNRKPWFGISKKWNQIVPTYTIREKSLTDVESNQYPMLVFPIRDTDRIVEFTRNDNIVKSTEPLERYSSIKKSVAIEDNILYLATTNDSGKLKVILGVEPDWRSLINNNIKHWVEKYNSKLSSEMGLKAKGYFVQGRFDLDNLIEMLDTEYDRVLCLGLNDIFELGINLIKIERS